MEMTFSAIFNRCFDDNDYPAYMAIQDAVDKDLKESESKLNAMRKAQNYYSWDCIKYYELEIEYSKIYIEFYEKLMAIQKLNSAPEIKYSAEKQVG